MLPGEMVYLEHVVKVVGEKGKTTNAMLRMVAVGMERR